MKITIVPASALPEALLESPNQGIRKPHYDQIAEALFSTRPGDWVRIALTDLPTPKSGGHKRLQGNVIEVMRNRKVGKIQTRVLGADLWVNVVREVKGKSQTNER
jgi:hypothetical protein